MNIRPRKIRPQKTRPRKIRPQKIRPRPTGSFYFSIHKGNFAPGKFALRPKEKTLERQYAKTF